MEMKRSSVIEEYPGIVEQLINELMNLYNDLTLLMVGEMVCTTLLVKINLRRRRVKGLIISFYDQDDNPSWSTKEKDAVHHEIQRMHATSLYISNLTFSATPHRIPYLYKDASAAKIRTESLLKYLGLSAKEISKRSTEYHMM